MLLTELSQILGFIFLVNCIVDNYQVQGPSLQSKA